jgi:uncharacterized membrane protein
MRFRNYGLWVAASALVIDVLIYANVITVAESDQVQALVQRGLEVLVLAGIISNPSQGKGFIDKGGDK